MTTLASALASGREMAVLLRSLAAPPESPTVEPNPGDVAFVRGRDDAHVVAPNDVQQGDIGDCYLLAAMRALAQSNPDQLQSLIRADGRGGYDVRIYSKSDGRWNTYHVSRDELGTRWQGTLKRAGDNNNAVDPRLAAPSEEGDIWVRIIEVAYAKHLKAHSDSSASGMALLDRGGYADRAMTALTGKAAERMELRAEVFLPLELRWKTRKASADDIGPRMMAAQAQQRPMMVSTLGDTRKDRLPLNLVSRHAYHVEAVRREEGTGRYVVTLMNPWGHTHPDSPSLPGDEKGEIYLDEALNQGLLTALDIGPPPVKPEPPSSPFDIIRGLPHATIP